jgi:serine/threonine-protein kinase
MNRLDDMIGPYRLTDVIGRGGMGVVYAAEHALLGRPAAIKVLLPALQRKQDAVRRFFHEAKAATAIGHPSIIDIYDFGQSRDGWMYIIMERLRGESLSRRARRGRLSWQMGLKAARQIAGALVAVHDQGIVHRDLKPGNIFLVPDPEVPGGERIKLLDFGVAQLAEDAPRQAQSREVVGTPAYMAPEQCLGGRVDPRADLYSLGCVIFRLCAGRPPFVGKDAGDVLAGHIQLPPPRIGALVPEIPPAVEELIHDLLAKRPEDRPQSAAEVLRRIHRATDAALQAESLAQPADTRVRTAAEAAPAAPRRGRRGALVGSVAVTAVAIITAAIIASSGPVVAAAATATRRPRASHAAQSGRPAISSPPGTRWTESVSAR